jgi:hypothetical protein
VEFGYYSVLVVSSSKLTPLIPLPSPKRLRAGRPLKQQDSTILKVSLFERGKGFERGLRPLSFTLPSPAINIYEFLLMFPAGEGTGVRLSHTNQMQTEPKFVRVAENP